MHCHLEHLDDQHVVDQHNLRAIACALLKGVLVSLYEDTFRRALDFVNDNTKPRGLLLFSQETMQPLSPSQLIFTFQNKLINTKDWGNWELFEIS